MKEQTFLVSDETKNSYGFRVLTSGIDTEQFERNPIMLFMHDRKRNVIGRWENLKKNGDKLYADAIFDTNDPQGKLIADKVENGFIKSASLGIEVLEQQGDLITKSKLHEISIVDIGSNKNALKLYNEKEIKQLFFNLNNENMSLLESLIALLSLETNATEEDVLKKVEELTEKEKKQLEGQKTVKQETLNLAVSVGKITADMLPQFSKMLDLDFEGTKKLLNQIPKKVNFFSMIKNPKITDRKENKSGKAKSHWNLEDYRRFAPNELERDPELYKSLLDQNYNH
ncbi:MAG: HK97 family phage prohead protease [Chryseobacterium sp.]|uniref:HK97 family phage prohead protease n=1 Tax=Chryseobacterium sp. TaxID=1871047 RepID=UPI001B2C4D7C|nr:HK97 family phage prohead protease [Chryseobacterium sp.]MBO6185051.1 HK97 family phage prohead protease [Chryseobacterium sp.]